MISQPQKQPQTETIPVKAMPSALPRTLSKALCLGIFTLGLGAALGRPVLAQSTDLSSMEQRLLDLEMRQRELMDEIDALRGQLAEQELDSAIHTAADPVAQPILSDTERPQGLLLSAEVLQLKPTVSGGIDFAIEDPGDALAVGGNLATLDYHNATDVRYGVGFRKGNVDVQARLLSIDTEARSSAERPDGGFLFTTLTHPAQNDSAETAEAETRLEYSTADLELGYALQAHQNFDVRLFAGLRFADTDQDFEFDYDGRDFTETEVEISRDFSGFGPRIGGDVRWLMGSGFSAFGRAAGSLLVGDMRSRYTETDNSGQDLVADLDRTNRDQLIPVAELALGLGWSGKLSKELGAELSVGYEYQNWFNAYNTSTFVDDSSPAVLSERSGDLSFRGFFVKTGLSLDF